MTDPSPEFVRRTRNPDLPCPHHVERTVKKPEDIVIENPAIRRLREKKEHGS